MPPLVCITRMVGNGPGPFGVKSVASIFLRRPTVTVCDVKSAAAAVTLHIAAMARRPAPMRPMASSPNPAPDPARSLRQFHPEGRGLFRPNLQACLEERRRFFLRRGRSVEPECGQLCRDLGFEKDRLQQAAPF